MTDLRIRAAGAADLPALLALYRHLHPADPAPPPAQTATAWQAMLAMPGLTIFLGERAGEAVASCTLVQVPNLTRGTRPYAFIENVVTHADHRRQGIGRAVLAAALAAAWAAGCYKVMLLTGSQRDSTFRFYEGAGFRRGEKTGLIARPPG
ncbi:GNAT family N-acetyltransferase [Siccirubricoccus sp. KC 17139]|uniref:GNAT family N-acetyltransferase n=1 Tax=Siccirubricoccus soli TaxID=2899147 RepID=A0ABT1D3K9_9PROT|nr:GNAT family N-acetyltransferase [Siccirubricoccus soli]MCO6416502.1 GNAT family N-acetyltransferase [Siccirubricoccus soli]MCP2682636.1 GNAT family N-acetyltransferase [Siccirubricoccus soli]